jgi:hypothetical protein
MDNFGDDEPEDAWHPDDPVNEQVVNLRRRLALLIDSDEWWSPRSELLLYRAVLALVRLNRLSPRDVLRADDLDTDIAFVLDRLEE